MRGGGASGVNGWNTAAPLGTQGAQFSVSTLGYTSIQLQFDWYVTTQGEGKLQVQYTTNGTTYINVPAGDYSALTYASIQYNSAGTVATNNTATALMTNSTDPNTVTGAYLQSAAQGWTDKISLNLGGITAASNDPEFGIRLVNAAMGASDVNSTGAALNNTSGNWRFDEVNISGTAINAVPEPGPCALVGLSLAGLAVIARRRTVNA